MKIKGLIYRVLAASVFGLFSLQANAAYIGDLSGDVYDIFYGNDADAADFSADTGIVGVTELFRDESVDENNEPYGAVYEGDVTKIQYLDWLVVKWDSVYGVYNVSDYEVGDVLHWATADFADLCDALVPPDGKNKNCGAATSHVTGYGVVPVPAAVWLFGSGLLGLVGVARRRRA